MFSDDKEDDDSVGYIPIEVDAHDIEKTHSLYIQSLINMHDKLKVQYKKYLNYLPEELYDSLVTERYSKIQAEPPKLLISHENLSY